ncbi:MAG TPA: LPS assembly protein LptD [Candidatus Angelobacter sp.]|nr:LPS assembly protein LptD [Candidatus Angelobacter sp.]
MRSQLPFVITAAVLCHLFPLSIPVASQTLPSAAAQDAAQAGACHAVITAPPQQSRPSPGNAQQGGGRHASKLIVSEREPVIIDANQCERNGSRFELHGNVKIAFKSYTFRGDEATYDSTSGEATATGQVQLDGGPRDIHITASHGLYNIRSRTGKFYDVKGTTGTRFKGRNVTLTSSSPIVFTGKIVEQTGPEEYILHNGSVTSCELPHPKWTFNAAKIVLQVGKSAKIHNATFRLKGVPVIYLPYASPPVERLGRQSGFLIPNFGTSTTKGTVLGDSFYWAINRSLDATLGGEYLSKRGWSLQENFRAKPSDNSYLNLNYFQVLDRGIVQNVQQTAPDGTIKIIPQTVNQGGEDIKLNGEENFAHGFRGVASIDYLSSFLFRLAFTENFSQAVDSEVRSVAFLSKSVHGFSFNAFGSRYQNFQSTTAGDAITILHTPALEFAGVEQPIFGSPVYWAYDVAAEGLRRSEPGFVTPGLVGRFDIAPVLSLPVLYHGWTIRPQVELRNTIYTQQQEPIQVSAPNLPGENPTHNPLNRRTIESSIEFRPPALAKVFKRELGGMKVKHTIEPRVIYRYTNGVENFPSIIRFDYRDILSNTNEVEYGLVQRLYLKHMHDSCEQAGQSPQQTPSGEKETQPASMPGTDSAGDCTPAGANEFISWEVKQKYFLDPTFGGVVVNGTRNVLSTTVDFTGIAFLTEPRRFSPIVSELRMRTSSNSDLEWELDYDTKKGRINASTLYSSLHLGNFLVQASHAYLQDPGETVTVATGPTTFVQLPPCVPGVFNTQIQCVPPVFNQFRILVGYGNPTKRGWSAAINAGVDSEFNLVQYSAAQSAYNWDCCGISLEYRRFSLGQVRNENQYRFAFTLANIGSFGNLRRQTRLF